MATNAYESYSNKFTYNLLKMTKKIQSLLWSLSLLCLSNALSAQSILSGKGLDEENAEPLMGMSIQVLDKEQTIGTVTNIDGEYTLTLPTAGKYKLRCSYVGYTPKDIEVEVDGQNPLTLDISLISGIMGDVLIVTEGKYEKKLEESTVSVDVINPKMIENNVITGLDEAIKKVSGVHMMDGQVNIRGGAGYAFGTGSRVSFLVDGQPLMSAELSDIKWNFIPLENAEQIEVIKGAGSVLYGSGALNGVINVRTAYPTEKPYTSFSIYSGVYAQPGVDSMRWYRGIKEDPKNLPMHTGFFIAHRSKLNKNFDLVVGGNAHIANGYIDRNNERRIRGNAHLTYKPTKYQNINAGVRVNAMYHAVFTYFLPKDMGTNLFVPINKSGLDKYLTLSVDPYVNIYDKHNNKHSINARWYLIDKLRGKSDNSVCNTSSLEYQFQKQFESNWTITAGAMYQFLHVNSILFNDNNDPSSQRALIAGHNGAIYAQVDKKFGKRFSITAGVRAEYFNIDTINVATPPIFRFGANYQIGNDGYVRASFGQGFRFPSLAERFINESIANVGGSSLYAFPNPNLKPEYGWTSEIAYRHVIKAKNNKFRMYLDAAMFWMEYTDMVEFQLARYPEGLGFKSVNIAEARIAGWELSTFGEGKIGKLPIRFWGGYTYSCPVNLAADTSMQNVGKYVDFMFSAFFKGIDKNNYETTDRLLRYRSLHNVRFDVETEYKNIIFGAVANFNSFVHGVDLLFSLNVIPGFTEFRESNPNGDWTFDLRLGYKFNAKQRLNLTVNNIANRVYAFRPGRAEAPRCIALKYQHTF